MQDDWNLAFLLRRLRFGPSLELFERLELAQEIIVNALRLALNDFFAFGGELEIVVREKPISLCSDEGTAALKSSFSPGYGRFAVVFLQIDLAPKA